MKKILFIVLTLACTPGLVTAQHRKNQNTFRSGSRVIPISQMDQRKIYNWANGQRSTPTGRQANNRFATYARVSGDSAMVVNSPVPKQVAVSKNAGAAFRSRSRVIPISQMDQRKIYNWANGQRSTPTGCQASIPGAKYARVFGDSAIVVRNPVRKN